MQVSSVARTTVLLPKRLLISKAVNGSLLQGLHDKTIWRWFRSHVKHAKDLHQKESLIHTGKELKFLTTGFNSRTFQPSYSLRMVPQITTSPSPTGNKNVHLQTRSKNLFWEMFWPSHICLIIELLRPIISAWQISIPMAIFFIHPLICNNLSNMYLMFFLYPNCPICLKFADLLYT